MMKTFPRLPCWPTPAQRRRFSRAAWPIHALLLAGLVLLPFPNAGGEWLYDGPPGEEVFGWRDPGTNQFTSLDSMGGGSDADYDSLSNGDEATEGSDPFAFDTDYDGLADGFEAATARPEVLTAFQYSLSLSNWDSDGDSISDHDEFYKAMGWTFADIGYLEGQLPGFSGATYFDYDGDGVKNHEDPVYDNPANPSPHNGTDWPGTSAMGDEDGDTEKNWWDATPWPDPPPNDDYDGDGIDDPYDPVPEDANNPSPHNGHDWPGTSANGDIDSDNTTNWNDTDSDGDGLNDMDSGGTAFYDPVHDNADNPSPHNGLNWPGSAVFGDDDADSTPNWWDESPVIGPSDTDGDGLNDDVDPVPGDATNPSPTNGRSWPGVTANQDNDGDNTSNWADADTDGDGLDDQINNTPYDPVPDNPSNPSSINNLAWPGTSALSDPDNDSTPNWWEPDTDQDSLIDDLDPEPGNASNPSPHNNQNWPGAAARGDDDGDATLNWWDESPFPPPTDPDGDGLFGTDDPVPDQYNNPSPHNSRDWPGSSAVNDNDGDSTANWWDETPDPPPPADTDGDGLFDYEEPDFGTDISLVDTDEDGLTDYEEVRGGFGSSPTNKWSLSQGRGWGNQYTDWQLADLTDQDQGNGDGIPDRIEAIYGLDSTNPADAYGDLDADGVTNLVQFNEGISLLANLVRYDADLDGMLDAFEDYYGFDSQSAADATADADGDSVTNFEEQTLALSPLTAITHAGSVGDLFLLAKKLLYPAGGDPTDDVDPENGIPDWYEDALGAANPAFRAVDGDIDDDTLPDVWEHQYGKWRNLDIGLLPRTADATADNDGDDLSNLTEFHLGLNPLLTNSDGTGLTDGDLDSDGDGVSNRDEELILHSHSWDADTDDDGILDGDEDSDGDGFSDAREIAEGTDPLNAQSNSRLLIGVRVFSPLITGK